MSVARKILIFGGLALAIWGMTYGLWYAAFAEHQALNSIGSSLAQSFKAAAERNLAASTASLAQYREAKYIYDRQVDVHGHWIGLGMLCVLLGIAFEKVSFSLSAKNLLAIALLFGAFVFPLGVLLQTVSHGPLPRAIAIGGSALMISSLAFIILGLTGFGVRQP